MIESNERQERLWMNWITRLWPFVGRDRFNALAGDLVDARIEIARLATEAMRLESENGRLHGEIDRHLADLVRSRQRHGEAAAAMNKIASVVNSHMASISMLAPGATDMACAMGLKRHPLC